MNAALGGWEELVGGGHAFVFHFIRSEKSPNAGKWDFTLSRKMAVKSPIM